MEVAKARAEMFWDEYRPKTFTYGTPGSFNNRVYPVYRKAQSIRSEGHPYHLLGRVHNRDIGGPFLNLSGEISLGSWDQEWMRSSGWTSRYGYPYEAFGLLIPTITIADSLIPSNHTGNYLLESKEEIEFFLANGMDVPQATSTSVLDARGAAIINSVKPTNPVVDLAEFFGELISERKLFSVPGKASSISGEYLNYMFGIAPTISTYQDLREAYENSEKILYHYQRDSGKLVRRRYDPEPVIETTVTVESNKQAHLLGAPSTSSALVSTTGTLTTFRKSTERWAFSGAFTYHLPKEGVMRSLAEIDKLYGVVPGVDTAYQLVPFSWLLDYFASVGDVLSNVNSFAADGLVMPYAYIMRERTVDVEYTWTGGVRDPSGSLVTRTLFASTKSRIQERRAANPFGFGLTQEALTPRQLSIIAALGLSRT